MRAREGGCCLRGDVLIGTSETPGCLFLGYMKTGRGIGRENSSSNLAFAKLLFC